MKLIETNKINMNKESSKTIDDDKELLRIKCGTLALMLLAFLLFTIMSIFLLYDLFGEVIDLSLSGNIEKEEIMDYVKFKFFLLYFLFLAVILIILMNSVAYFRKKLCDREGK